MSPMHTQCHPRVRSNTFLHSLHSLTATCNKANINSDLINFNTDRMAYFMSLKGAASVYSEADALLQSQTPIIVFLFRSMLCFAGQYLPVQLTNYFTLSQQYLHFCVCCLKCVCVCRTATDYLFAQLCVFTWPFYCWLLCRYLAGHGCFSSGKDRGFKRR